MSIGLLAAGGPVWAALAAQTASSAVPPIRSHSREMPEWAKNNHKPTAAQYAELMLDADVHAALKRFLNPFKMPIQ